MKRPYAETQRNHGNNHQDSQRQQLVIQPVTALALLRRPRPVLPSLLLMNNSNSTTHLPWTRLSLGVNQLSGPAGCAKTQIALSMCLQAAAAAASSSRRIPVPSSNSSDHPPPHHGIAAIYLSLGSTRHAKIAQRLEQMAKTGIITGNCRSSSIEILRRILLKAVMSPDDLLALTCPRTGELGPLLQDNTSSNNTAVKILVLDDIATLFRVLEGSVMARSAALFTLAANLKRLSDSYQVPVLVLNQVTAKISNIAINSTCKDQPALGLSWAQCVNQDYSVARKVGGTRLLALERSSSHGHEQVAFEVQDCGVVML